MVERKGFYWQRLPRVETYLRRRVREMTRRNSILGGVAKRLEEETSTRLMDWVDHLLLADSRNTRGQLEGLGFRRRRNGSGMVSYHHEGGVLPPVVLSPDAKHGLEGVFLHVESIADFQQANGLQAPIEGSPLSPLRRSIIHVERNVAMGVVERRGTRDFEPVWKNAAYIKTITAALEAWQTLPRGHLDDEAAWSSLFRTARRLIRTLGPNMAAHIVCQAERAYWMTRNPAARTQKGRQDSLGMGWANHDHHTFRSSRRHFARLVRLFSELGFEKRERFYAGREAGWGAQLMENHEAGLVLFLDVDLAPDESALDFSAEALEEREAFGTVGLWCALHGDSILQAGMHHLAGRFVFDWLVEDLEPYGVEYMAPFSNFSYLKQAFSKPERWKVPAERINRLAREGLITRQQAEDFTHRGAVGSHLENIQRREGYKGFNRKNVSAIIRETDPRRST